MPEGHTIHRIARDHQKWYAQQVLSLESPQGRFSEGCELLDGHTLERVEAHGKHLFYRWEAVPQILHIHLGLYGKFRNHRLPPPEPRGAVRLRVIGDARAFDLNGPNACELITEQQRTKFAQRLGPDPLRKDADPDVVWDRIHKSRMAIGGLLLNQSVVAGIGNVYRAELLYMHGIHPSRQGRDLSRSEFDDLWDTITKLLKIGVRYNRIITVEPEEVGKTRSRMNREERLQVYKKDHCGSCGNPIQQWELAARTMYSCEICQT